MEQTQSSKTIKIFALSQTEEKSDSTRFLFFLNPMPPHVLMDFVVLPPGRGRSVTDF